MYYILAKQPKHGVLSWLNIRAFKSHKKVTVNNFSLKLSTNATGIVVTSWEHIDILREYYTGIVLFQGKKPSYNTLVGMCTEAVCKATGAVIHIVCAPTLDQLFLKQYKVIYNRCVQKILPNYKKHFLPKVDISIRYIDDGTGWKYLQSKGNILFLAIDTETKQEAYITTPEGKEHYIQGVIDLVSATAVTYDSKLKVPWVLTTIVMPFKNWKDYKAVKEMCESHYPKSFQNGLYDIEYFNNWHCPVNNYLWDTEYYTRSITSDFTGKYNLAAQVALWCHESFYWKELASFKGDAKRTERQQLEYINYSGLDAHWTAMVTLNQMMCYDKNNIFNYVMRSKSTPFCSWCNLQGFLINDETHLKLSIKYANKKVDGERKFKKLTGLGVNQSAEVLTYYKSMKEVCKVAGIKDVGRINSTDAKASDGLRISHPMFQYFVELVQDTRTADKWVATFLNFKKFIGTKDGRNYFKYALNNFTTASMRLSSKSSNMWCGGNAQNVTMNIREMWCPPEGYVFFSIDAPSSEAYTTAYLSDEEALINVLLDPAVDFHKYNGSKIFEIPYDDINKLDRKLAKPSGFGFFYGMLGAGLLMTMGVDNVRTLRDRLNKSNLSLIKVASITIQKISDAYPKIRGTWYFQQLSKIVKYGRLPFNNGFAPVICGDVLRDKKELNSCMSLEPQGLSADLNLGGCTNVLLNILKDNVDDKGIIPLVQIHDELIGLVPETLSVDEADKYLHDCFLNATVVKSGKVMRIPPGTPVYALNGKALKADELPRGAWTKGMRVKDITTDKYKDVVPKYNIDFDVKDVEFLLS